MSTTRIFTIAFLLLSVTSFGQQPRLVIPTWHNNEVNYAEFSPDQKMILTLGEDGLIKIWSNQSGKLLRTLEGHSDRVNTAFFSPDSKLILTSSRDSSTKLWDIRMGKVIQSFDGLGDNYFACFSPDGKMMIIASPEYEAVIYEVKTGKVLQKLGNDNEAGFRSAQLTRDGKLAMTSNRESSKVWETASGRLVSHFKTDGHLENSTFSPDGKWVLSDVAENKSSYVLWEAITGKILHKLDPGSTPLEGILHFSHDGTKILGATDDSCLTVWEASSGKLLTKINGHRNKIYSAQFSPDDKLIATSGRDRKAKLWDAATGKLIYEVESQLFAIRQTQFSPDGKRLLLVATDDKIPVIDSRTGVRLFLLDGRTTSVGDIFFRPDGKYFFSNTYKQGLVAWEFLKGKPIQYPLVKDVVRVDFSKDGQWMLQNDSMIHVWDTRSASKIVSWRPESGYPNLARFNRTGDLVMAWFTDNSIKIFETTTGKVIHNLPDQGNNIKWMDLDKENKKLLVLAGGIVHVSDCQSGKSLYTLRDAPYKSSFSSYLAEYAEFSPDGMSIVTASAYDKVMVWDAATGKHLKTLLGHSTGWHVLHAEYSHDGKQIVSGAMDKNIMVWETNTGQLLYSLAGHRDIVKKVRFSNDGHWILSSSNDGETKLWSTLTKSEVASFIAIDSSEYITKLPNGYYQCSPGAAKLLHYVNEDLQVITFQQLDIKYNRPDKVMEALGNPDTAMIRFYHNAWEKRIRKLQLDTSYFREGYSVPQADFADRDKIEFQQAKGTLKLRITGSDNAFNLDRYNVWVNEIPVFGQRGISIRNKRSNKLDITVTINLSEGTNTIEASVINVNGTESYRMPLIVNYTPSVKQKESLRFIGIGIDRFSDSKYNLQYSNKDIRDLSAKLKEKYGDDISIDTLFNENVNVKNVKALKQKLQQTTVNDKVIIAYSGHGMLSKDYDYYLSTYAVNFDKPEQNGLPYEELENLLDSIPARKKLMLIDACHSGEVDKDDLVTLETSSDSLIKGLKPVAYKKEGQLGLKNSFELMQSLFVNVGKSTGATIISAAAGTQFALERGDLKNGVFTYSILEAMSKNKKMTISELKKIVGERVEQLTNGMQKPTSRNETIAVDWTLW